MLFGGGNGTGVPSYHGIHEKISCFSLNLCDNVLQRTGAVRACLKEKALKRFHCHGIYPAQCKIQFAGVHTVQEEVGAVIQKSEVLWEAISFANGESLFCKRIPSMSDVFLAGLHSCVDKLGFGCPSDYRSVYSQRACIQEGLGAAAQRRAGGKGVINKQDPFILHIRKGFKSTF